MRDKSYRTQNTTLGKKWLPKKESLDELFNLADDKKVSANKLVRVAYQYPFEVSFWEEGDEAIPYTFEDALVLSNIEFFRRLDGSQTGLIRKMSDAVGKSSLTDAATEMFTALDKGKKAEMALELLYIDEPHSLETPKYIAEGLQWLQEKLQFKDDDFLDSSNNTNGDE